MMKKIYTLFYLIVVLLIFGLQGINAQKTVLEDFETKEGRPAWVNANNSSVAPAIVLNPSKDNLNASDSVLLWIKNKDSKVYAAAMSELQAYIIQFNGSATYMHFKMLKNNTDPCALQVIRTDDGIGESGKVFNPPVRIPCPTVNQWVDYVVDFSAVDATSHTWSRVYIMPVMNATVEGGWTEAPLDADVNVYIDDITVDSEMNAYQPSATTVFVSKTGEVSYILNNPVVSELILEGIGEVRDISLYSINGSLVKHLQTYKVDSYKVPVADLAKGIYIVKFQKEDGSVTSSKIIKR
jgi:type IX secretion system substrate protein